jgi:outer membrane protein TolC
VGTIGAIEVLSSKAGVARNESNVIIAERYVQSSEENLKRILNMSRETFSITPMDKPEIKSIPVDFNTFLTEALQNRPEIKQAKLNLDSASIGVRYSRNQALPSVTFLASINSYGLAGTKWDVDLLDPTFPRTLISKTTFKDSLKNSLKFIDKDYTFQLGLSMPIGFSREKAALAKAKINREQAELNLQNQENTIFSEVKDVVKELESSRKLVEADRIAMELEEQNLKAEEKKLSVGLSTNFQVLTYQQQYAQAQSQALSSTISYIKTLAKINRILNRTFEVYGIKFGDILKD